MLKKTRVETNDHIMVVLSNLVNPPVSANEECVGVNSFVRLQTTFVRYCMMGRSHVLSCCIVGKWPRYTAFIPRSLSLVETNMSSFEQCPRLMSSHRETAQGNGGQKKNGFHIIFSNVWIDFLQKQI